MQPVKSTSLSQASAELLAALLISSNVIALHWRITTACSSSTPRSAVCSTGLGLTDVSILDLLLPAHRERVGNAMHTANGSSPVCVAEAFRGETKTFDLELRFEPVMCDGKALLAIFAQDVTDRYRVEAQLNLLAFSDPLTGLGNRAMFADRLRHAMLIARRTGQSFAVLAMDLDNFKPINDCHGDHVAILCSSVSQHDCWRVCGISTASCVWPVTNLP